MSDYIATLEHKPREYELYDITLKQLTNYIDNWKYTIEVVTDDLFDFYELMLHGVDPLEDYSNHKELYWKSEFEVKLYEKLRNKIEKKI
jgi:hypothetical protein